MYCCLVSVPLALLGLLEREPSYGYDLKRDYDAFFGRGKPLPFGQVYSTLARLSRDGKVTPGEIEPGEGPDRKRYVITEDGKREFEIWLTEPVSPEPNLQTCLLYTSRICDGLGLNGERMGNTALVEAGHEGVRHPEICKGLDRRVCAQDNC